MEQPSALLKSGFKEAKCRCLLISNGKNKGIFFSSGQVGMTSPNVTQNPCTFQQSDFTREQQPALNKVVFGSVGLGTTILTLCYWPIYIWPIWKLSCDWSVDTKTNMADATRVTKHLKTNAIYWILYDINIFWINNSQVRKVIHGWLSAWPAGSHRLVSWKPGQWCGPPSWCYTCCARPFISIVHIDTVNMCLQSIHTRYVRLLLKMRNRQKSYKNE